MATQIAKESNVEHVDVLIVGAGISGIGMAVHLSQKCSGKSFAIWERRQNLGGTWDLFQYPGIRSDSDMHTLGYSFEPWTHERAIADGPSIIEYLHKIKGKYGLDDKITFDRKVLTASWSSENARWTVEAEGSDGSRSSIIANFLYMGAGYYDHDDPHDAGIAGIETFKGDVVHPQFWPKDLDYAGKRAVIIGSGATAVTILPVMAETAQHVTMLQRTPTYYVSRPAKDGMANFLRTIMPDSWAYAITRFKNIQLQNFMFKRARKRPGKVKNALLDQARKEMGGQINEADFTPPYNPWEQRLCLVPDSDMFKALQTDRADMVTDQIETVTEDGIMLKSGKHLDADIIVTATGLRLAALGKVTFEVDGKPISFHDHFYYKGCMYSNVPNLVGVFGYLNASWTLKADIVSEFTCRLLRHMDAHAAQIANPVLENPDALEEEDLFDFSAGYIQRSLELLPRNSTTMPWKLTQDYLFERKVLRDEPINDGVLQFYGPNEVQVGNQDAPTLEAAE